MRRITWPLRPSKSRPRQSRRSIFPVKLPAIPFSTRIKSHTRKSEFYKVDLSGPTCSCPDFRSFRHRLPTGHLTRCCKHVFDAYAQLEPSAGWPGWLRSFLELAHPPHPKHEWDVLKISPGWFSLGGERWFVLISSPQNHWANIFTSNNGAYDRYGYNLAEIAGHTRSNRRTARKSEKP